MKTSWLAQIVKTFSQKCAEISCISFVSNNKAAYDDEYFPWGRLLHFSWNDFSQEFNPLNLTYGQTQRKTC